MLPLLSNSSMSWLLTSNFSSTTTWISCSPWISFVRMRPWVCAHVHAFSIIFLRFWGVNIAWIMIYSHNVLLDRVKDQNSESNTNDQASILVHCFSVFKRCSVNHAPPEVSLFVFRCFLRIWTSIEAKSPCSRNIFCNSRPQVAARYIEREWAVWGFLLSLSGYIL